MNILLVGGRPGVRYLIRELKRKNHAVSLVDPDETWCRLIADECEIPAVCGDAAKAAVLKNAGAGQADLVAALEEKDTTNLLICETVKKQFRVPKTLALVSDTVNEELFRQLGVDRCICTTRYMQEVIEQELLADSFSRYFQLENGRVSIVEVSIEENSAAANQKLWSLGLPAQSIVGCIIRSGQTIIPQGNTELKPKDKVLLLCSAETMQDAVTTLTGSESGRLFHRVSSGASSLF